MASNPARATATPLRPAALPRPRRHSVSEALGENDRGQVVGASFGAADPFGRAFIWQDGRMTDLNTRVAPGTTLFLTDAQEINDRGVITGQALVPATQALVAFKAVPIGLSAQR